MNLRATSCCALKEIARLSDHKSAKEAMIRFCELSLFGQKYEYPKPGTAGYGQYVVAPADNLHHHYIFSGVIREGNRVKKYGTDFAAFIRKHHLGDVVGGKVKNNRKVHPTHHDRVWVWNPNVDALKKWCKANVPTPDVKKIQGNYF